MRKGSNRGLRCAASAVVLLVATAGAPLHAAPFHASSFEQTSLLPRNSSGRVVIVVSTDLQKLTVYDDGVPVASSMVSTGVADHPTPHGIFSIIGKERFHRSNLYSDAPMPWMQRITWSGVALHEGRVTGRPASHGCIRLPAAFAAELFRYTREGARVIVARDDVSPGPWGSISLFTPSAGEARPALRQSLEKDGTSASYDVEIESRPRFSASTSAPTGKPGFGANAPISLLVNRKTGKLSVRRAFKPLFQVPISIDDPARPLGTHMFVMQTRGASDWVSASIDTPVREASLIEPGTRPRRLKDALPTLAPMASSAWEALSRLHLAPGTATYIASLLTPGATLLLSEDGARNRETQDGTNFIVLTE